MGKEAAELIVREDPDLAIVVVDRDDEHALALIGESVELASGPVIAQLREGDVDFVARAAERGISAYVTSNDPERVQTAVECGPPLPRGRRVLHDKIRQLEGALERRAVIERANGLLMERHGVDEREAFERLRDHARATGQRVFDVAEGVLDGHVLRPGTRGFLARA